MYFPIHTTGEFSPPDDGFVQVLKPGEHWNEGAKIMQVCDDKAMDSIIASFNRERRAAGQAWTGLLVDFDHNSHDLDKSTRAAAWIQDIEKRDDGLWAQFRFTRSGEEAVRGGDFRGVSAALTDFVPAGGDDPSRMRPTRLMRVALTNCPNIKGMIPASNRTTEEDMSTNYKSLITGLLGLAPTATDEEITGACEEVTAMNRELESTEIDATDPGPALNAARDRIEELQTQLAERDAKDFVDLVPGDAPQKALRRLLATNREDTLAVLTAVGRTTKPAGNPPSPVHDQRRSPVPPIAAIDEEAAVKQTALAAKATNRAHELIKAARNRGVDLPFNTAFRNAVNELRDGTAPPERKEYVPAAE